MSAEKHLLRLPSFWIILGLIVSAALVASIAILLNNDIYPDPSVDGFNRFIAIFKVPLGILALVFPAIALVASNHRSVQVSEQIKLQNSQNIFANYYTHLDKFIEYVQSLSMWKDTTFSRNDNIREYHAAIFPNAKSGDYTTDGLSFAEFRVRLASLESKSSKVIHLHKTTTNADENDDVREAIYKFMVECEEFFIYVRKKFYISIPISKIGLIAMIDYILTSGKLMMALVSFNAIREDKIDLSTFWDNKLYVTNTMNQNFYGHHGYVIYKRDHEIKLLFATNEK